MLIFCPSVLIFCPHHSDCLIDPCLGQVAKKAKRKEMNDTRGTDAYCKKAKLLDEFGSWLRYSEAPNGKWWCHFCISRYIPSCLCLCVMR